MSIEDELKSELKGFDPKAIKRIGSQLHDRESSHAMSRLGGFLALAAVPMALTFSDVVIHDTWARYVLYGCVLASLLAWFGLAVRSFSMIKVWKLLAKGELGEGVETEDAQIESAVYDVVVRNRLVKLNSTFTETLLPPLLVIVIVVVVFIEKL